MHPKILKRRENVLETKNLEIEKNIINLAKVIDFYLNNTIFICDKKPNEDLKILLGLWQDTRSILDRKTKEDIEMVILLSKYVLLLGKISHVHMESYISSRHE